MSLEADIMLLRSLVAWHERQCGSGKKCTVGARYMAALNRLEAATRQAPTCQCGRPLIPQGNGSAHERRPYEIGHDSRAL